MPKGLWGRMGWLVRPPRRELRSAALLAASMLLAISVAAGCSTGEGSPAASHPPIVVKVEESVREMVAPVLQAFQDGHPSLLVTWPEDAEESNYNAAVASQPLFDGCREEVMVLHGLLVTTPSRQVELGADTSFWFSSSLDSEVTKELAAFLREGCEAHSAEWTMHLGGDIIPGRRVAKAIVERGPLFPFEAVAPLMQGGTSSSPTWKPP